MTDAKRPLLTEPVEFDFNLNKSHSSLDENGNTLDWVDDRLAMTFPFKESRWTQIALRYQQKVTWDPLLNEYPMLKYPSMIFGYTTNLLHPLILYSILCVYFCMLFLIHTHSSQSFTLFDGVVDLNAMWNLGHAIITPITMYFFFRNPLTYILLGICHEIRPLRTAFTVKWTMIGAYAWIALFFSVCPVSNVIGVRGEESDLWNWYLALPSQFFMAGGLALALWCFLLQTRLVSILILDTEILFSRDLPLPSSLQAKNLCMDQDSDGWQEFAHDHSMNGDSNNQKAKIVTTTECLRQHDTLSRLLSHSLRSLLPIAVWKTFADFSGLLLNFLHLASGGGKNYFAPFIIIVASLTVAGVIIVPPAILTTRFRNMLTQVAQYRPWCRTEQQRDRINALVTYLQPFAVHGGVVILGIAITAPFAAQVITIMYTLFAASNFFD